LLYAKGLQRRQGVAATGERKPRAVGHRLRHGPGTFRELRYLEHPDGAVPEDGAGAADDLGEPRRSPRTDIENHVLRPDVSHLHSARLGVHGEAIGNDDVDGQRNGCFLHEGAGCVEEIRFGEGLANGKPGRGEEGVGDATARNQPIDLAG
jgi:hypothetical protein